MRVISIVEPKVKRGR